MRAQGQCLCSLLPSELTPALRAQGHNPSNHKKAFAEEVRRLPWVYWANLDAKRAVVSPGSCILWHKMDHMIVDCYTAVEAIVRFLLRADYDFFGSCSRCKEMCTDRMVRCGACVSTFCLPCVSGIYEDDAESQVLGRCPKCAMKTVSYCTNRFVHGGWTVSKPILALCQGRATRKLPENVCARCRQASEKVFRCSCSIGTPYCSKVPPVQCMLHLYSQRCMACICMPNSMHV